MTRPGGVPSAGQVEAKAIFLGDGGVGKTCTIAALCGKSFIGDHPTTHVELTQLPISDPPSTHSAMLNVWDVTGQPVTRHLVDWYLTAEAICVIVFRSRAGMGEVVPRSLEDWLTWTMSRRPRLPIVIVETHGDEARQDIDWQRWSAEHPSVAGYYKIDNRTGRGIADLRAALGREAIRVGRSSDSTGEPEWNEVRTELFTESRPYIGARDFLELTEAHGMTRDSAIRLARHLHITGNSILIGDLDNPRDLLISDPRWATDAITAIIDDHQIFNDGGVVPHTRLRQIWEALGDLYPQSVHPHLLHMMEFLDISMRLPSGTASLVAQSVTYGSPNLPWDHRSPTGVGIGVATCRFEFQGSIPGIIPYLIVRTHENSVGLHWRHGLFLRHRQTESEALIELVESRILRLTVRAPSPGYFFKELTATVDTTLNRYWQHLRWRAYVPCRGHDCVGEFEIHSLRLRRLRGLNDAPCVECGRLQDLGSLLAGAEKGGAVAISSRSDQRSQALLSGHSSVIELAVRTSDTLDRIQSALAAAREAVPDCPRLFLLVRDKESRISPFLFWRDQYKLELWCEHRGFEHPWKPATYHFTRPKKTVVKMAPYLTVVLKTLRLIVPAAGPVAGITLAEADAKVIKEQMAIMKAIVDSAPEISTREDVVDRGDKLTPRHGAALRAFRSLLMSLDSSTYYGGLEKVYTPSGAMLWVCPEHYSHYVELPNLH